ncbi:MAG TPA: polysaccharide biosynthesis C-terminal domain-containing protein, partial [Gaiellaceae bacterium]|nr:polysaccharide biosynthesis C-terminal domain-containing protein [Gaiellaceae bacterium]
VVLAIALVSIGLGVRGLAVAATATAWITCVVSVAALARIHPHVVRLCRDTWRTAAMLRFSLPQTLSGMLFFTILWTDTLFLARFGSAAQVGVYTVAGRLVTPAMLISTAIGQMFAPRIAAADARGAHASLSAMLKRVTYWNTVVSLPFFAALAVAAAPLLRMFGGRYAVGATALTVLAVGQLVNTAAGPLGQVINMSGRPYVNLMNNALVAVLNVAGCLVLIPRYGLTGAACSTAGALTLVNAIKLVELRVMLGLWPFRSDSLRTFAAAGGAAALAAFLVHVPSWGSNFLEVAVVGTVLFVAYLQLVVLVAVRGEERAMLRRRWIAVRSAAGRGAA